MSRLGAAYLAAAIALATGPASAHGMDSVAPDAPFTGDPADPDTRNDDLTPASLSDEQRPPARAIMDAMKLWAPGARLHVCFVAPVPGALRQRIVRAASEWMTTGNILLDFSGRADQTCVPGRAYEITIGFKSGGASSYTGTDSKKHKASMNLEGFDDPNSRVALGPEQEFTRVVMHEFGHALGMMHEHQSPQAHCGDHILWSAAERYYKEKLGWSAAEVHDNLETLPVLARAPRDALQMTTYDNKSIMQYAFPAGIFKEGADSPCYSGVNYVLSDTDKELFAKLYPKGTEAQDKLRRALLAQLDKVYSDGGVPESERKDAIAKIAQEFNLKLEQTNNAGRDVNATTILKLEQNSNGAGAVNMGTVNGNVTFGTPPTR